MLDLLSTVAVDQCSNFPSRLLHWRQEKTPQQPSNLPQDQWCSLVATTLEAWKWAPPSGSLATPSLTALSIPPIYKIRTYTHCIQKSVYTVESIITVRLKVSIQGWKFKDLANSLNKVTHCCTIKEWDPSHSPRTFHPVAMVSDWTAAHHQNLADV